MDRDSKYLSSHALPCISVLVDENFCYNNGQRISLSVSDHVRMEKMHFRMGIFHFGRGAILPCRERGAGKDLQAGASGLSAPHTASTRFGSRDTSAIPLCAAEMPWEHRRKRACAERRGDRSMSMR